MTTSLTHILKSFDELDQMLDWALANGDNLGDNTVTGILQLAQTTQKAQTKINALEKRLRPAVAHHYDCEEGKTKNYTLDEMGLKVEVKRPASQVLAEGKTFDDVAEALDWDVVDVVFPTKRSFSKTEFKKLPDDTRAKVAPFLELKPGALSVKVTSLY